MGYMKLSFCLLVVMTLIMMMFVTGSRHGEKIHFHDSSEVGEFDIDKRPVHSHGKRNHRGRVTDNLPQFEEGITGVYPIKGPPQAPLILLTSGDSGKANYQPVQQQQPLYHHYVGNHFLRKKQMDSIPPTTNKITSPSYTDLPHGSDLLEKDINRK